tara:strand:+ start:255 stop:665 length:411 start_codon:yes stop_codon:yes gene_type:complete
MELKIRVLKDEDYTTLKSWWDEWPDWTPPPKESLPEQGRGGFLVEKNNIPIVAGFLYLTNSTGVLLEWIVSNPNYKEVDRKDAIELLINSAEKASKELGYKYMFSIGRSKNLMETHERLGWHVDNRPSHEIIKTII